MDIQTSDYTDKQKVSLLLYSMGAEYMPVYKTFDFANSSDRDKIDVVKKKFNEYFEPKKLLKKQLTMFQARVQRDNESVTQYITAVKQLATHCEFGSLKDRQIALQISNGVRDIKLKEKLWEDDLSLDKLLHKCSVYEQLLDTKKMLGADQKSVHQLSKQSVRHRATPDSRMMQSRGRWPQQSRGRWSQQNRGQYNRGHVQPEMTVQQPSGWTKDRGASQPVRGATTSGRGRGYHHQQQQQRSTQQCQQCGSTHGYRQCPAFGKQCFHCGRFNHYGKMCRNKKTVNYMNNDCSNATDDNDSTYDKHESHQNTDDNKCEQLNIFSLEANHNNSKDIWKVSLNIFDNAYDFMIDTLSQCTVIPYNVYSCFRDRLDLHDSNVVIKGFGGSKVKSLGYIMLPVQYKGQTYSVRCEVVQSNVAKVNILSNFDSVNLGLVRRIMSVDKTDLPTSTNEIMKQYSKVFDGIGKLPGKYQLKVKENAIPVARTSRPISVALRAATLKKLEELEKMDIIEKVPIGTPYEWCSNMHIVPKRNGDVRVTIDPGELNKVILREFHPMSTVDDIATRVNGSKLFTTLDANMGYFQLELDEQSQPLTCFITPFGRYMYKRLPMGITAAPELYQRAMSELFNGVEGVEIVMDDILIHATTQAKHDKILTQVLQICEDNNLKLNREKTHLCKKEVEYVGHIFSADGMKICSKRVESIMKMPYPKNKKEVMTIIGMVTYTCKFLPHLSSVTEPLRQLIKDSAQRDFKFEFEEKHKKSFDELKKMMSSTQVLRFYDAKQPVLISCDASSKGLGYVLLQDQRPVIYGSKSLTKSEQAYAQIEKEMLSIVSACKKFHHYIYGRDDVTIETDHLPLIRIFEKPLHAIPLRLQKMKMRLQHYSFKLIHSPGTDIPVSDGLSRFCHTESTEEEYDVLSCEVRSMSTFSDATKAELIEETRKDEILQLLSRTIKNIPETRARAHHKVRPYWNFMNEISEIDGILFRGDRVMIPNSMQAYMLKVIHQSHLGVIKCKQFARDLVYWRNMNSQIEEVVSKCEICQQNRNYQQKEPLQNREVPDKPWCEIAADLCECNGDDYLIVVDSYSEYIEIKKLTTTTSIAVIRALSEMFATHGICEILYSDNGPQFSSQQFKAFSTEWKFKHVTSSPTYPQSNGLAERAVQTAKRLIKKCREDNTNVYLALLNLRNTPVPRIGSPAQRMFGRRTKTLMPTSDLLLKPETQKPEIVKQKLTDRGNQSKQLYDKHAREMQPLVIGDTVRVRDRGRWKPAKIVDVPKLR